MPACACLLIPVLVLFVLPGAVAADSWEAIPPPPARSEARGIYDSQRDRFVIYGGGDRQVWAMDLVSRTWESLPTVGDAPEAHWHSMIYDPVRDRLIVYGGYPNGTDLHALKFGEPSTWVALNPTGSPPLGRDGAAAIYDPVGDRMIVHGGDNGGSLTDTWALNLAGGTAWSQITTQGTPPSEVWQSAAAYDLTRHRIVFHGGGFIDPHDETWELTLNPTPTWTQLTPGTGPGARSQHTAAYDAAGDRLVLFGGDTDLYDPVGDLWELTFAGTPAWNLLSEVAETGARSTSAFAHDTVRNALVLYGGFEHGGFLDDTWSLDLDTTIWLQLDSNPGPGRRALATSVMDEARGRWLVIGGTDNGRLNDVWSFDLATRVWTELVVGGVPPSPRYGATAVLDPTRDQVLLFGGNDGRLNRDVWALSLDPPTWSGPWPVKGSPPPRRQNHAAVFDVVGDRMIVIGGLRTQPVDVWELSMGGVPEWKQWPTSGGPGIRREHEIHLDAERDRMLLWGGTGMDGFDGAWLHSDLWELPLHGPAVWAELSQNGEIPWARGNYSLVHDPDRDRLVLYAGGRADIFSSEHGDVRTLDLETLTWSEIPAQPVWPETRLYHVGAFDTAGDRMIVFGGSSFFSGTQSDTWILNFSSATTAVPERVVRAPGLVASPNPFRSSTMLTFRLTEPGPVRVTIHDVRGRVVRTLHVSEVGIGEHRFRWDGRTDTGERLSNGIYFARVETTAGGQSSKLVLMR